MIIARVFGARAAKTKLVTIPKSCDILPGDFVVITKVKPNMIFSNEDEIEE